MIDKDLTYRQAIRIILTESDKLSLPDIERRIIKRQLRKNFISSSFRSVLNKDIQKGDNSEFIRDKRGVYSLRLEKNVSKNRSKIKAGNKILVFKPNKLKYLGNFHGIRKNYEPYVEGILKVDSPIFMERAKAERTASYKQVVSYIIIEYKNELLRFVRHTNKVNKFLDYIDGKFSVGFGGHVQSTDFDLFSYMECDSGYKASLLRELKEETGIIINNVNSIKFIGVLNDESTPRGHRHFAFVHFIELSEPYFETREKWVRDLKFVSFEQISEEFAQYEYWSKICLQTFFGNKFTRKCYIVKKKKFSFQKPPQYLAIVGGIGTGKSKICSILEGNYNYEHIPCSKILQKVITAKADNKLERRYLQDEGYKFINSPDSHEIFAKSILETIEKKDRGNRFLIDGLRYPETLHKLEQLLGSKIPILYIETTIDKRYENYSERENREISFLDFLSIIDHPVERSIEKFIPLAKIIIYNIGSLEALITDVTKFFQEELSKSFLVDPWDINAVARHAQLLREKDITFYKINMPEIIERLKCIDNYPLISVLDVGCGTGVLTNFISKQVSQIIGIDPSRESIRIARQSLKNKNLNFECTTIEDFKTTNQFDAIVANMTLHTIKYIQSALKKIYDLLTVGGDLIFTLPHPRYYPLREDHRDTFLADGFVYEKESFHEIPFNISLEPEPLPSPTPYFHRPMNTYDALLDKVGFWLIETRILYPTDDIMTLYGKRWDYPHILLGVARRP